MALHPELVRTLQQLVSRLDELGVDYRIIGAVAVHAHGWFRGTEDIDLIVTREGHRTIIEALIGRGYLPKARGSRHIRNRATGIGIDLLIAGVSRPGSDRGPAPPFPDPADRPPAPAAFAPGAKVIDLERLIELKLLSYRYGRIRDRDLGDVVELLRANRVAFELGASLPPEVRPLYEDAWRRVEEWRADPGAGDTEHAHEPVSPYFAEVSSALDRGEITVEQAIARLTL